MKQIVPDQEVIFDVMTGANRLHEALRYDYETKAGRTTSAAVGAMKLAWQMVREWLRWVEKLLAAGMKLPEGDRWSKLPQDLEGAKQLMAQMDDVIGRVYRAHEDNRDQDRKRGSRQLEMFSSVDLGFYRLMALTTETRLALPAELMEVLYGDKAEAA